MHVVKVGKEQNDLARANFSIIRKEAQAIVDLVIPINIFFSHTVYSKYGALLILWSCV
jgi:hypothetical protein